LDSEVVLLHEQRRQDISRRATKFNTKGYRVIAIASREIPENEINGVDRFDGLDANMALEGLLTFLDPPKDDAKARIERLQKLGVSVKLLTEDNLAVALKVCRDLELVTENDEANIEARWHRRVPPSSKDLQGVLKARSGPKRKSH